MSKNFLLLILKSVRHRPLRSWLTVLGIIIGIMLVVVIFSLSSGIQTAIAQTLRMFGSDLIYIFPGKETNPLSSIVGGERFREKDLLALEKIQGVKFVVPVDAKTLNLEFRGEKKSTMIHAAPWKKMRLIFESSQGVKVEKGAWPRSEVSREVVLGYLTANSLFKEKIRVGDEIILKSSRMKVVGILSKIGNQNDDNSLFVSLADFREITGSAGSAFTGLVKVEAGADANLLARQIKAELSRQDVVRDFAVLSSDKVTRLIKDVLTIIELTLIVISLVSLIVGAIGIMNTMYTSVLERVKQIGVMKAIGASYDDILSLFLIESGVIGLAGGILGIILGIFISYLIGLLAAGFGIRGVFSFESLDFMGLLAILIVTFVTGVIAGVLPARQAAKMEPAEALRYE
jgi:putative ABC transport system permease protein